MCEGVDAVDRASEAISGLLRDSLRGMVDATHGVQDPELVSGSDGTGSSAKPLERGKRGAGSGERNRLGRVILVFDEARERRPQIVRMHPVACSDMFNRQADGDAVFYDLLIALERIECNLVARRNFLARADGASVDLDASAGRNAPQRDRDIVVVIDTNRRRAGRCRQRRALDRRAVRHSRYVSRARSYASARAITRASSMSIR